MARYLIATLPVTGHVAPGLPIARALVSRGHQVRWYTGGKFRARVEATGATYVPMRAGRDFDDSDLNGAFPGRDRTRGVAQLKFDLKHIFIDAAAAHLIDLRDELLHFPADAMLGDSAMIGIAVLAERNGLPWATFGITVLTASSRDTAPFGLALKPSATTLGRLRNRGLSWAMNAVLFRDVIDRYAAVRQALGYPRSLHRDLFDNAFSPYLVMLGTMPGFEYPRSDLPPQVHFVGPLPAEPMRDFIEPAWWPQLKTSRAVVHVTQGTASTEAQQLIIPALKGLAREDVLVVVATGGREAPANVPANARVAPFLPYDALLPQVHAMVTNGGFGGVQLGLSHGIPLVVAGNTEEKPEIARRVAWSGAGIDLRTGTPSAEQIRRAVRRVLDEPGFRARAQALRDEGRVQRPAIRAAELLEQLVATGRPVTRG